MEFFQNTKINFMGRRRIWIAISLTTIVASVIVLFGLRRFNLGVDFAGGTQLTVKFQSAPEVDYLRSLLADAGLAGVGLQRYGLPEANEVIIKTPEGEGGSEGSQHAVRTAFDAAFNGERGDRLDLNHEGRDALSALLASANPDQVSSDDPDALATHYDQLADRILNLRERDGILSSWDTIRTDAGLGTEALELLKEKAYLGAYTVLQADNVGPQIGAELRTKGILAVVFSIIGMLIYIWLRFELRFGLGAVVALFHDVIISLGAFALMGYEFNLTTVAAFLTVVGYSVNDTVVVFDRVRENLRQSRREPLKDLLNRALNQTLSRTVLTSGTTLLAVGTLYFLGGEVIRGFAFVLLVGIIVGTYSSIFIASPVVLAWETRFGRGTR